MSVSQDILDVIVVPINEEMEATTFFYDYGHVITFIPPIEDLSREDIRRYLHEYNTKIDRLEIISRVHRIERLARRIYYALRLFWKKRKIKRLQSLSENGTSITITTQTPSEAIAITSIELDGDVVLRLTQCALGKWRDELFKIHETNVRHALLMWREDVQALLDVLKFAVVAWRLIAILNVFSYLFLLGSWRLLPRALLFAFPITFVTSILAGILYLLRR